MKRSVFNIIAGFVIVTLIASGMEQYKAGPQTAEVETKSGLYIFTDSKPVKPYTYIATVKSGFVTHGYYDEVIQSITKRVKKQYPEADAIIFVPNAEAEVIKFK